MLFRCKIDDCGQTTNFRCMRPMPFNCIFYCGCFDIYHSGLAWPALFFVTVYIVKISTVSFVFLFFQTFAHPSFGKKWYKIHILVFILVFLPTQILDASYAPEIHVYWPTNSFVFLFSRHFVSCQGASTSTTSKGSRPRDPCSFLPLGTRFTVC